MENTYPEQIRPLKGFEAKVVVVEVAFVFDNLLEGFGVVDDYFKYIIGNERRRETILCIDVAVEEFCGLDEGGEGLFLEVGYSNPSSESLVLRIHGAEVGRSFCGEVIQLLGAHTVEYTLYYLLCYKDWIYIGGQFRLEVAQNLKSSRNLVKGNLVDRVS